MKKQSIGLVVCALAWLGQSVLAQVPQMINYQGRIAIAGTNFDGTGQFQFALVNNGASVTYWSNGVGSVAVTVSKGLYAVLLGDTTLANMAALPTTVFTNSDVRLRVWFNDGVHGAQLLTPDQRLAAAGYALVAQSANVANSFPVTSDLTAARLNIGCSNTLSGSYATIGGGQLNTASGAKATVAGGYQNSASGVGAFIGGGGYDGSTTGSNVASGAASVIGGGIFNMVTSNFATIGGGWKNKANADYTVIGGGYTNIASGPYAVVGGGAYNTASGYNAAILGGWGNDATEFRAVICGGYDNTASGSNTFIGCGYSNGASTNNATVGGGYGNHADGLSSVIAGGSVNTASGDYAAVLGGNLNVASGQFSFAGGRQAKATNDGAFVWADNQGNDLYSTTNKQFTVRATGGVRFFTNAGATLGVQLTNNATAWSTLSDRNAKENIEAIDTHAILASLVAMPVTKWSYKDDPNQRRYIGPMAQDFHAAFGLGDDNKRINTLDTDGVTLAAIQGLYQELSEEKTRNAELEKRLTELETLLKQVIQKQVLAPR